MTAGWLEKLPVDEFFPRRGPCAFCDLYDQRHRIIESIAEQVRAGDPVSGLAEVYEVPVAAIEACLDYDVKVDLIALPAD